jgi:hypothetical protein
MLASLLLAFISFASQFSAGTFSAGSTASISIGILRASNLSPSFSGNAMMPIAAALVA